MAEDPRTSRGPDSLCLGTVKLGDPAYGFSSGPPPSGFDPISFLDGALARGIRRFDTSPRYGAAEEILGRAIARWPARPFVSSKIDRLRPGDPGTTRAVLDSVAASLRRLNLPALDVAYLHQNELAVLSDPGVREGLEILLERGLARAVGASLYSREEVEFALGSGLFGVIQVPVNVFDLGFYERFIRGNRGPVRFAARSLLLQGILRNRQGVDHLHPQAGEIREYLEALDRLAASCGLSTLALALSFVFSLPGIDHFLIGTASLANLEEDLRCLTIRLPEPVFEAVAAMASKPKAWTNPRSWTPRPAGSPGNSP